MTPLQTVIEQLKTAIKSATEPADIALLSEKMIEAVKAAEATDERLMTVEEAAHFLGLQPSTARKMASAQRIPCIRVGSKTMFSKESLLRWAKEQERPMHRIYRKGK